MIDIGLQISLPATLLGLFTGITYGLLAVGLVLVYRSCRFVNFAHVEIGLFGAAVLLTVMQRLSMPYYVALPIGMFAGAFVGSSVEALVVRPLKRAPKLMSTIATLGVARFLFVGALVLNPLAAQGRLFPEPPGIPGGFLIGGLLVRRANMGQLMFTPLIILALILFLKRSRYGMAIRASAANPDAATLAGLSPKSMQTLTWGLAGAVSTFTVALLLPILGTVAGATGPSLLLRALAAGVIGRMNSIPIALASGIGIGVIEANFDTGGFVSVVVLVVILVALVVQKPAGSRDDEGKGAWSAVEGLPPIPEEIRALDWRVRNIGWIFGGFGLVVACLLPIFMDNAQSLTMTFVAAYALVGLSIGVVSGLAGQLALGQFALAAIGAFASWQITLHTGIYPLGFLAAGIAAAFTAVIVGIPALRVKGLFLAVTTLAFAVAAQSWLLKQELFFGSGAETGRPVIGDFVFDTARRYYYVAVAVLAVGMLLARNIKVGAFGRLLVAIRDNEDGARAFAVNTTRIKLQGYALAGALAGIGGAVYGHTLSTVTATDFPATASIDVVAISVIGGVGVLAGPVIGALYLVAIPLSISLDSFGQTMLTFGWLALITAVPSGLAGIIRPVRDRIVAALAGVDPSAVSNPDRPSEGEVHASLEPAKHPDREHGTPLLVATNLTKTYGGLTAVNSVDLEVREGEILGLIGPNGAGKTTLFEIISGFVAPDSGTIVFAGSDITSLSADSRAKLGLLRSFQDSALFPTMTLLETVTLSQERETPTQLWESGIGLRHLEAKRSAAAREVISLLGLDRFRDTRIAQLSTGTRRIAELACLLAMEPRLLLLDEPSSGIAQRESEALGDLLLAVRAHLDCTMVVIEHDIPLVTSISDRMVAMETGGIICTGDPETVMSNAKVAEAFLGGELVAIERSGTRKVKT